MITFMWTMKGLTVITTRPVPTPTPCMEILTHEVGIRSQTHGRGVILVVRNQWPGPRPQNICQINYTLIVLRRFERGVIHVVVVGSINVHYYCLIFHFQLTSSKIHIPWSICTSCYWLIDCSLMTSALYFRHTHDLA